MMNKSTSYLHPSFQKTMPLIVLMSILCALPIFGQIETICPSNSDHPKYQMVLQVTSSDTIKRGYILHIPANYDNDIATPLVINLHGFGDCASDFSETVGEFYRMDSLADSENFIVAYPQAAYRPLKDDVYWEPGDNGESDIYTNDVYFIEQLIADINMDYNLDLDRVYAAGYSNGGMMAYSLACKRSDLFAAIGIMSGVMLPDVCDVTEPTPIIKFHGIEDEVLPYEGNAWYQSVSEIVEFWLDQYSIPSNSRITTEFNDGKVVRDGYLGGNDNSCFVLYTVNEEWDKPGGHVWFSDKINGSSPNKLLWDFFSKGCDSVTSSHDLSSKTQKIIAYPNPFYDQLSVDNKNYDHEIFKIYNIHGEMKFTGRINSKITNLASLPPGIYILQIGNQKTKIIKSK